MQGLRQKSFGRRAGSKGTHNITLKIHSNTLKKCAHFSEWPKQVGVLVRSSKSLQNLVYIKSSNIEKQTFGIKKDVF